MAGARVTLTDLPHITPFSAHNLSLNADKHSLDAQASARHVTLQSLCACMMSQPIMTLPHAQRQTLDDCSLCMCQRRAVWQVVPQS